jgi:predicted nucleotidyltransferase
MGLLNAIKRNPNIRKIFGKQELKIIEKQLMGVNLRASERTRLSRDIRKKFEAIKELSDYILEFQLKKGANIKDLINDAKEVILKGKYFLRIKKIILFGSAAENQLSLRSDIDIAVEFDKIDVKEATRFRLDILPKVNERVDVQVYNVLPEKIRAEIDLKGKVIYEKNRK